MAIDYSTELRTSLAAAMTRQDWCARVIAALPAPLRIRFFSSGGALLTGAPVLALSGPITTSGGQLILPQITHAGTTHAAYTPAAGDRMRIEGGASFASFIDGTIGTSGTDFVLSGAIAAGEGVAFSVGLRINAPAGLPLAATPTVPTTPTAALPSFLRLMTKAGSVTAQPFTAAIPLPEGALPAGEHLVLGGVTDPQVDIESTWNGAGTAARVAIVSGKVNANASGYTDVTLSRTTTAPTGTALTVAELEAAVQASMANPQVTLVASPDGTTIGTAALAPLMGAVATQANGQTGRKRIRRAGPNVIEVHYTGPVGADPHLRAFFHVRLYRGGKLELHIGVINGYVNLAGLTLRLYTASISINGAVAWNNGGAVIEHSARTRWRRKFWSDGFAGWILQHDHLNAQASLQVPDFDSGTQTPSAAALNTLLGRHDVDTPFGRRSNGTWAGAFKDDAGGTGGHESLGIFSLHDAMYWSCGDARAFRAMELAAEYAGRFPVHFYDVNTAEIGKPSDHPTLNGQGGNRYPQPIDGTAYPVSTQHQPAIGYAMYLADGDYWHIESCEAMASMNYFWAGNGSDFRDGAKGLIVSYRSLWDTRGTAHGLRTLAMTAAIGPDGSRIKTEWSACWAHNADRHHAVMVTGTSDWLSNKFTVAGGNIFGFAPCSNLDETFANGAIGGGAFTQHFLGGWTGFAYQIAPGSTATRQKWLEVARRWLTATVGMLGDDAGWVYWRCGQWKMPMSQAGGNASAPVWFPSWRALYLNFAQSRGLVDPPFALGIELMQNANRNASNPASTAHYSDGTSHDQWGGFIANLVPASAYAVDLDVPGAAAARQRLTSAPNWNTAPYADFPIYGIKPRLAQAAPPGPPVPWVPGTVTPPYAMPAAGAVANIPNSRLLDHPAAKCPEMTLDQQKESMFNIWATGDFVRKYSAGGAWCVALAGGHSTAQPDIIDTIIFEPLEARWNRLPNAAGVANKYPGSYTIAETQGAPDYLLQGPGGTTPPAAHTYGMVVGTDDGTQGSLVWAPTLRAITRESSGTRNAFRRDMASGATTKFNQNDRQNLFPWIAFDGFEGVAVIDRETNKQWLLSVDMNSYGNILAIDGTTGLYEQYATGNHNFGGSPRCAGILKVGAAKLLVVNFGDKICALDITSGTTIAQNWSQLTVSGPIFSPSGKMYAGAGHRALFAMSRVGVGLTSALFKLTPPVSGSWRTATWTSAQLTLGGVALASYASNWLEHYNRFVPWEAAGVDMFLWITDHAQLVQVVNLQSQ